MKTKSNKTNIFQSTHRQPNQKKAARELPQPQGLQMCHKAFGGGSWVGRGPGGEASASPRWTSALVGGPTAVCCGKSSRKAF